MVKWLTRSVFLGAGINPQHALTYWPSIRPLVTNYIALAGDFHGTIEANSQSYQIEGASAADWQQSCTLPTLPLDMHPLML